SQGMRLCREHARVVVIIRYMATTCSVASPQPTTKDRCRRQPMGDGGIGMPESPAATGLKMDYEAALQALSESRLAGRPVIIASNRGPVEFHERDGVIRPHRGQGGLVTAVRAVASRLPATWVSAPLSAADQTLALAGETVSVPADSGQAPLQVRFIA